MLLATGPLLAYSLCTIFTFSFSTYFSRSIIVRRCVLTAFNKRILYCIVLYCYYKVKQAAGHDTYEREEYEESSDVAEHAHQRDLQRAEHLERRHQIGRTTARLRVRADGYDAVGRSTHAPCRRADSQIGRTRDAQHVGDGKQYVGHDLRVVRHPLEPRCMRHVTPHAAMLHSIISGSGPSCWQGPSLLFRVRSEAEVRRPKWGWGS